MQLRRFLLAASLLCAFSPPFLFSQSVSGPITSTQCVSIDITNKSTVGIQVTGTWTGTLQPQISIQGQAPQNVLVTPYSSSTSQPTITGDGNFSARVGGGTTFLLCGNTVSSGTANVWLNSTQAVSLNGVGGGGANGTTTSTVTPEQFGAVGNGVHDDTSALQAAINACSGAGLGYMTTEASTPPSNYCTVVLGEKVYLVTSGLTVAASQVRIVGQGMRASIIMCNSATADILTIAGTAFTNTGAAAWDYFSDFAVMRNVAPTGTPAGFLWKAAIWNFAYRVESWDSIRGFSLGVLAPVGHINLYDVQAVGGNQTGTNSGSATGFYFSGSLNSSRCTSCVTSLNGGGFYFTSAADMFMDRCEALTSFVGYYVTGGSYDLIVRDGIIEGGSRSIDIESNNPPNGFKVQFYGGYWHGGTQNPIYIHASSNVEIIGGDINAPSGPYSAIGVDGSSHDVLIAGMQINVTLGSGTALPIAVSASSRITVSNNVISAPVGNPGATAIILENTATYNTVIGNSIGGYFTTGILADATSSNNTIVGNTIDPTHITTQISDSGAGNVKVNTNQIGLNTLLLSTTAPTISSGFGTSASIVSSNGSATFRVNVGTGGTATSGVIGLPTATTGWNCQVTDTTNNTVTRQTASTTTSVTVTGAAAWAASDVLIFNCAAF